MALNEAVMEIVTEMEKSASDSADKTPLTWSLVRSWTLALKSAVKASQTTIQKPAFVYPNHREMIDAEREKIRKQRESANLEETDRNMVRCMGGDMDGVLVPLSPEMPEGAYTGVGGGTYQKCGNRLVHVENAEKVLTGSK